MLDRPTSPNSPRAAPPSHLPQHPMSHLPQRPMSPQPPCAFHRERSPPIDTSPSCTFTFILHRQCACIDCCFLPFAILAATRVHISRRVVGVARFGDPDHVSAARSDTFLYVLATSTSIDSGAGAVFSNPLYPSHRLVFACWLCSARFFSLRCLARTHTVSTSIVLACVRRSCGRVADGVLMQSLAGTLLFYYNVDWLPVATDHSPFPPAPDPLPPVASSAHAAFELFPHAAPLYVC